MPFDVFVVWSREETTSCLERLVSYSPCRILVSPAKFEEVVSNCDE